MKLVKFSAMVLGFILVLFFVILSPMLLQIFGSMLPIDAQFVGQFGGSYGAVSALLSALALCILAATSFLQVRQTSISQLHSSRSLQLELLRMSMDQPDYRQALGQDFTEKTDIQWRLHAYLNLWIMNFQMGYLTGAINEQGLRAWLTTELFGSRVGTNFWKEAKDVFLSECQSRAHRKFFNIVDAVYLKKVIEFNELDLLNKSQEITKEDVSICARLDEEKM